MSTAACFPGARVEKTWSGEFGGDGKDRWEVWQHLRLKYLDSLCESWMDRVSPTEVIRASEDRLLWQHMVVNVIDNGTAT